MDGMTRRDAVQRVVALMGGLALAGGEQLEAFSFDAAAYDQAMAEGVGAFTAADVALLDEIAETILPETTTPGAKAARTGAFMALMVTDAYSDANQQVFRDVSAKTAEDYLAWVGDYEAKAVATMKSQGANFKPFPAAELKKWRSSAPDFLAQWEKDTAAATKDAQTPKKVAARWRELLSK